MKKKTVCFAIDTHWRTNSQNDEDKTPILSTKMCSNATILLMLSIAMRIEQTLLYDVDFVISFLCLFCFVLGLLSIPALLSLYALSRLAFVRHTCLYFHEMFRVCFCSRCSRHHLYTQFENFFLTFWMLQYFCLLQKRSTHQYLSWMLRQIYSKTRFLTRQKIDHEFWFTMAVEKFIYLIL